MYKLRKGVPIHEFGLTDMQMFAIFDKNGAHMRRKEKELSGDLSWKTDSYMMYYDSLSNRLYFLSRGVSSEREEIKKMTRSILYKPYESESTNGGYLVFSYFDYSRGRLTVYLESEVHHFFMWLRGRKIRI